MQHSHEISSPEYDRVAVAELGRTPGIESARLFKNAAQRRNLTGAELVLARTAREEIQQRARRISALTEKVAGLPLTADECSVLRPPFGRATHLPSPDRPYVHLAVHTGQGGVSVTPVWAAAAGGNVVLSTVENRIKARATALDPLVALSVPAGVGSQICLEIGGFARQSPDSERELIRTLARMYSKPKVGEQVDGNYTSWDQRERNERLRLEILAYRVRNELGDDPVCRSAPYVQELAPRFRTADAARPSGRGSHDEFWGPDERYGEDEPELRGARDELAILGMTRRGKESTYRSLSPTYGHLACFDHHGLLRCRQIGFDVIDVKGEARISFLVKKRDTGTLRKNPAVAVSVAQYSSGSVWLQAQGLIQFHDDPGMVQDAVHRLESRYNRVHHRSALDLGQGGSRPEDHVLATLSRQKLSSRYRETERSLRSAHALGK
ncbi:hypothetical protein B7767_19800 [Streptomyces sp. 13-12-16]|uniref:hypothetical protein n=1 Tax=Streptomyces sp. 13-12-16 TaxID=1570823 RepID=UPI000A1E59BB|nr:hypothetical protein [Streptomyces sp. 13-12-16]OSP41566.1 hypothetical protein B7767_19800 [Streptomyces sp. 13-12-16]